MKKVAINSIDLSLGTEDDFLGTLKVLLTRKGVMFIPSTDLEKAFSKEEYDDLKTDYGKIGITFS